IEMSLPKHASPPRTPSAAPRASSACSSWAAAAPGLVADWFAHPRTLGMTPKTLGMLYASAAISGTVVSLAKHFIYGAGFSFDMLLMLVVVVTSSVAFWALTKRRPLALTPFLITVILGIIVIIVIWFIDHVPQSAYKCDELLALGALVYLFVHCIRTVLAARRQMIEDIKNERYGRF
ncbi:hypothetical protein PMAYCL1PPCAC_16504, partial [Pristionchus mayeri]